MAFTYTKPVPINLRTHADVNEKWVQDLIYSDPSILGLGPLVPRGYERGQPFKGRLDLLLQEPEILGRRYEIEVQLGPTDESHIIRTLEYWDHERKLYPQYDHCAVLIAETITSRFFNVMSLFNGTIPFIAIQMQALEIGEHKTLIFTTVLEEFSRGPVDEDEEAQNTLTDRTYWEAQATKSTLALADSMLEVVREFDPSLNLKYNKIYVGLERGGLAYNFIAMRPKKAHLILEVKIPRSDDIDQAIDEAGIDRLEYSARSRLYRLRISQTDLATKRDFIRSLCQSAYERRSAG